MIGGMAVGGCIPTVARQNAHIEDRGAVAVLGGVQYIGEGKDGDGNTTSSSSDGTFEVDVQSGWRDDTGSAFALQVKVPANLVFLTFDAYYEMPSHSTQWFYGMGAELSIVPGVYGVLTRYLSENLFVTFTQRVLLANQNNKNATLVNPQLSLGFSGPVTLSVFASFAHHTGQGYDFSIDLFSDTNRVDYRKNFWLLGSALRF